MKRILCILSIILTLLLPTAFAAADGESRPSIRAVHVRGAVVSIFTDRPVTAYCITTLDVVPDASHPDWRPCNGRLLKAFKTDGSYFVRVRDENGAVSDAIPFTVESEFRFVAEAEGLDHLTQPIGAFLEENGDGIDAFNARIAKSAADAGLRTRAAVGNVGMTLLSDMAGYGMTLSYQPRGNFTQENDWGLNPEWGARMGTTEKDSAGTYCHYGMNCGTIIVWVYKQAGLNLGTAAGRRGIYDSGLHRKKDDNKLPLDAGDTGDIIATKTGHTMMILDRVDTDGDGLSDSYYVLEMESPYLKLKLRSLYSVRMCTLYDMSAVFDDSGRMRENTKLWTGSFRIPPEAFPAYYDADAVQYGAFGSFDAQTAIQRIPAHCLIGRGD
jgi:hypothetical protein